MKFQAAIFAPPASLGSGGIDTVFSGDMSKCQFPVEHRILGAALGQPKDGYHYRNEAYAGFGYLYNSSGHNEALDSNVGRTAACFQRTMVYQAGQGDAVCLSGSVFVTGEKPGSTSFLANPAGCLFNGGVQAGHDGVYLNPYETDLVDNGHDVAAAGNVNRLKRTNDAGAKHAWWAGYRVQSSGSKAIDVGYSAIGPIKIGADFSFAQLPASGPYQQAAVTLKAGQRIYGNADGVDPSGLARYPSSLGSGEWIEYSGAAWLMVAGNAAVFQVSATQATVTKAFRHTGNAAGFFNASPAARPTITGAKGGNAALASLLSGLATLGLVTDSTS